MCQGIFPTLGLENAGASPIFCRGYTFQHVVSKLWYAGAKTDHEAELVGQRMKSVVQIMAHFEAWHTKQKQKIFFWPSQVPEAQVEGRHLAGVSSGCGVFS